MDNNIESLTSFNKESARFNNLELSPPVKDVVKLGNDLSDLHELIMSEECLDSRDDILFPSGVVSDRDKYIFLMGMYRGALSDDWNSVL